MGTQTKAKKGDCNNAGPITTLMTGPVQGAAPLSHFRMNEDLPHQGNLVTLAVYGEHDSGTFEPSILNSA